MFFLCSNIRTAQVSVGKTNLTSQQGQINRRKSLHAQIFVCVNKVYQMKCFFLNFHIHSYERAHQIIYVFKIISAYMLF